LSNEEAIVGMIMNFGRLERPELRGAFKRGNVPIPLDLKVLCLWTALGAALTALIFTLGFGAELGKVLALTG
jgi:hypothetical protein